MHSQNGLICMEGTYCMRLRDVNYLLNTTRINSKSLLYCTGIIFTIIMYNGKMEKNLKKNMYIILLYTGNQHNIVN